MATTSNNTKLSETEFGKAVELTFKAFDSNKDSFLTKQELAGLLGHVKGLNFPITQALVDHLYQKIDLKKDGKVDMQEFYSVMKTYYYNK